MPIKPPPSRTPLYVDPKGKVFFSWSWLVWLRGLVSGLIENDDIKDGEISASKLSFTPVGSENIVATINASEEGIDIAADKISISGETVFSSGYDPSEKVPEGGAAQDVNDNVTTINGGKLTTGTVQASALNFTPVQSTDVVAKINASAEGIRIEADNIAISGSTQFEAGYDPTGKIASGGAAADVNAGVTTINGGKITTGSITAEKIQAGSITTNELNFTPVQAGDVIAKINASAEGIRIEADNIAISGLTQFASGYDPTSKIAVGGAAADVNNGVTTIDGDKITTGSITADQIDAQTITADEIAVGTITVENMSFSPLSPLGFGLPYLFGDGSDGDVTIASDTNYASHTIKQFHNLIINAGAALSSSAGNDAILFIFCTGTLTVNGWLTMAGKGGAVNGGTGEGWDHTSSRGGSGGAGGNWGGQIGKAGGSTVVAGGNPSEENYGSGNNGSAIGTANESLFRLRNDYKDFATVSWGTAGGNGNGLSDDPMGGDGGGGLIIFADTVVVNSGGWINANGDDGTDAPGPDGAGGGGAGGGGFIWIVTRSYTNSGTVSAAPGTGGSGYGGGGSGGNGGAGTIIVEEIPW